MSNIEEQNMEYGMTCFFRTWWTDERLAYGRLLKNQSKFDLPDSASYYTSIDSSFVENIWTPDVFLLDSNAENTYEILREGDLKLIDSCNFWREDLWLKLLKHCELRSLDPYIISNLNESLFWKPYKNQIEPKTADFPNIILTSETFL